MIKRLKARHSGTMVANPRRKKRSGGHKSKSRKKRGLRSLFANPRGKRKKHNPRRAHKRRNPLVRRKRRNPDVNIGGVSLDLVSVGVGSVAAIALGSIGQAVFDKYLSKNITNPALRSLAPNALVAGAAWAATKYMKNPQIQKIAKVTLVLSVFKMIDDSVGKQIHDSVKNILPGSTGGLHGYIPAVRQMNGVHIDNMGGAYTYSGPSYTHGILPGANLYGL